MMCEKCAFKSGSPERKDEWGWGNLIEQWKDGDPFYCHEGIKGHYQYAGKTKHLCHGWKTNKGKSIKELVKMVEA